MDFDSNTYYKIIARAWADENYMKALQEKPRETLTAAGMKLPEHAEIHVVANTDKVIYFPIPQKPANRELSEEELTAVAGGDSCLSWS